MDVLHGDEDIDLTKLSFEPSLEVFEELQFFLRNDLNSNDVVNEFDTAITPSALVRSKQRADCYGPKAAVNCSCISSIFSSSIAVPLLYFSGK